MLAKRKSPALVPEQELPVQDRNLIHFRLNMLTTPPGTGCICTNSYITSALIAAIGGVYYIYYKAPYAWSHIGISRLLTKWKSVISLLMKLPDLLEKAVNKGNLLINLRNFVFYGM